MFRSTNRRTFLKSTTAASASLMALGASSGHLAAQDPTPVPTVEPVSVGEGGTEISMWVQDFGPVIDSFRKSAEAYVAAGNDVKVTVQPIASGDLLAKMLPSIAAGNEADIIMGYTDWYVATDISKLFLNLDGLLGTKAELEQTLFESTLSTLDMPDGSIYYLPYLAGVRAAVATYNGGLYEAAGIDPATLSTWEDFVAAAQQLTKKEGDAMTVAGLSPASAVLSMIKNWIWQVGGEFYNGESGEWTLSTPEGEYLHDCKDLWFDEKGEITWRGRGLLGVYCTHSLGPLLYITGERVTSVSALGVPGGKFNPAIQNPTMYTMQMVTDAGTVLKVRVDHISPRPHQMHYYQVQGTRGSFESWRGLGDESKIWLEDIHEESRVSGRGAEWHPASEQADRYIPDRLNAPEEARLGGHWTSEYWMLKDFIAAIREEIASPIDVYRALDYTIPGILAVESAKTFGTPIPVPDPRLFPNT